jgi:hypothetical protein
MAENRCPLRRLTMSAPAAYLIRVRGWVDESWRDYFDSLSVTVSAPVGLPPETILCGRVRDQTALMGVLHRLHQIKTTLMSVECLET